MVSVTCKLSAAIAALGLFASVAQACLYDVPDTSKPVFYEPFEYGQECSFVRPCEHGNCAHGQTAENLGNGYVSQIMSAGTGYELWVVADCNRPAYSVIYGAVPDERTWKTSCAPFAEIQTEVAKKDSYLRRAAGKGLEHLEKVAERKGHSIGNAESLQLQSGPIYLDLKVVFANKVDPMCGCRLYYPESAGAKK